MPERIQLSRKKGWRMPANAVKVDRSTRWGNPFVVVPRRADWKNYSESLDRMAVPTRADAIRAFRAYCADRLKQEPRWLERLRGKNLACWCKPGEYCHADVLLELANQPEVKP